MCQLSQNKNQSGVDTHGDMGASETGAVGGPPFWSTAKGSSAGVEEAEETLPLIAATGQVVEQLPQREGDGLQVMCRGKDVEVL
jgi:hypothetical protein